MNFFMLYNKFRRSNLSLLVTVVFIYTEQFMILLVNEVHFQRHVYVLTSLQFSFKIKVVWQIVKTDKEAILDVS